MEWTLDSTVHVHHGRIKLCLTSRKIGLDLGTRLLFDHTVLSKHVPLKSDPDVIVTFSVLVSLDVVISRPATSQTQPGSSL